MEANIIQLMVAKEKKIALEKANKAKEIQDECQKEIDMIQPELDRAQEIVNKI